MKSSEERGQPVSGEEPTQTSPVVDALTERRASGTVYRMLMISMGIRIRTSDLAKLSDSS